MVLYIMFLFYFIHQLEKLVLIVPIYNDDSFRPARPQLLVGTSDMQF